MTINTPGGKSTLTDVKYCTSEENSRLLVLLERKNLSQAKLGEKIGKSRQYINAIVHNRIFPSKLVKKDIACILECDTIDIWPDRNDRN